jgi:outer membrane protein TolC
VDLGRRRVELLGRAVPQARDSYLTAESEYRGGAGTAVDVLTAFQAWIDVESASIDAVLAYRDAEAAALRWGGP